VIVPPKEFFQFCAKHVGLLRELEQRSSETDHSELEIDNITKNHAADVESILLFWLNASSNSVACQS
jgi:hypothetical protein